MFKNTKISTVKVTGKKWYKKERKKRNNLRKENHLKNKKNITIH